MATPPILGIMQQGLWIYNFGEKLYYYNESAWADIEEVQNTTLKIILP